MKARAAVITALLATFAASAQARTVTGYLTMRDGTPIKYTAVIPNGNGPFPVVFTYDGYASGVDGGSQPPIVGNVEQLVAHGYVALGANVPGTGCSGGNFTLFTPDWGQDGAQIIEWAARQPWSDGNVGEIGHSFAGFDTWFVAADRPPHLKAIAPESTDGDFYQDAVYPGGIWNYGITDAFFVGQQNNAEAGVQQAIQQGDAECAKNYAVHEAEDNVSNTTITQLPMHPYHDSYWLLRATDTYFSRIDVPVLTDTSWQDAIAGAGLPDHLQALNPNKLWFIGGNGNHDEIDPTENQLFGFLDHYLKHTNDGWQRTPHIQLWEDDQLPDANAGRVRPAWIINFSRWPLTVHPFTIYLRAGNALSTQKSEPGEPPDTYQYPRSSASTLNDGSTKNLDEQEWKLPFDHSGTVDYTSARLPRGLIVAGPGSLDLWVSSDATDTDLQATITEVRPDGQEQYVQRGWLRLSHREINPSQSTPLLPVHYDTSGTSEPVMPGQPVLARLMIFPFSHAFRGGSRIRIIIDAPTTPTGVHLFEFLPNPAVNTIYHDPHHPSLLRLGQLWGIKTGGPRPACDQDMGEPCRGDPFATQPVTHDPMVVPTEPMHPANRRKNLLAVWW
jgi:hypothetical protein